MKKLTRITLLTLLLVTTGMSLPNQPLAAQDSEEEEGPAAFVPTEKLPADAAVSFPVDI